MIQHFCDGEWVDGPLKSCDLHGQRVHGMPKMRIGPKTRRNLDREAGQVGTDRGGYISGTDEQA